MDIGKGVSNHYKGVFISLPYLFDIFYLLLVSLIELKFPFDLQKFLENPIHSHLGLFVKPFIVSKMMP